MIIPELQDYYDTAELEMSESLEFLKRELSTIRAGKASTSMLDGVKVDYYGSMTPLNQVANVSTPEARLIVIQPWEKGMIGAIERAIHMSGMGFNPSNDGQLIRIPLPMLTEERRRDLVKVAKDIAEKARVAIRNARRDANDNIKKAVKAESLPEDARFSTEAEIQKLTDNYISKVEELLDKKEKEIMTV